MSKYKWLKLSFTHILFLLIGAFLMAGFANISSYNQRTMARSGRISLVKIESLQYEYHEKHGVYAESFKELNFEKNDCAEYFEYVLCHDLIKGKNVFEVNLRLPDFLNTCASSGNYYVYAIADIDMDKKLDVFMLSNKYGILHIMDDSIK